MHNFTCAHLIVLFTVCLCTDAEFFSAISHMEPLILTHKKIKENLDEYISQEEKRLDVLKKFLITYKTEHKKAIMDIPNYLGNPINCFTLIKRLTHDLQSIENKIKDKTVYRMDKKMQYPSKTDIIGVARAMDELHRTYGLDLTQMSNGILKGNFSRDNEEFNEVVTPLTASDCFMLGSTLIGVNLFIESIPWLLQALDKYNVRDNEPFTEADIREHISHAYYVMGDINNALEWTVNPEGLKLEYHRFMKAEADRGHYKQLSMQETKKNTKDNEDKAIPVAEQEAIFEKYHSRAIALCRGEMELPSLVVKRLKCQYITEHHPFLKLAPIKVEQLYLEPDIFLMHGVLSDREMQYLRNLSTPMLKRAEGHVSETGKNGPVDYRTCKIMWVPKNESEITTRVAQRIADFTGLSVETSDLQVVNYGVGGFYSPHFDYATTRETLKHGHRIATVLFYMSEVAQGGATVFPELGLSVFPVRGAALFWRNLHPSGEGDEATSHAGCSVLHGSKWIATCWLNEHGQEFLRPCNLNYQKTGILHKIPPPVPKKKKYS